MDNAEKERIWKKIDEINAKENLTEDDLAIIDILRDRLIGKR